MCTIIFHRQDLLICLNTLGTKMDIWNIVEFETLVDLKNIQNQNAIFVMK